MTLNGKQHYHSIITCSHSQLFGEADPERPSKNFVRCCEILDTSRFSKPTLLHMDIKPANIIYNDRTGTVFEFARFRDIDYGWTQILWKRLFLFRNSNAICSIRPCAI